MNSLGRRCWTGVLVVGLATTSWSASLLTASPARAREQRPAELQVLRQGDSVSLVVKGVGSRARLEQQKQTSFSWEARIVSSEASGLRAGTQQQVSLPTAGLESVMLLEAGDDYILRVVPDDDTTLAQPQISSNGGDLLIQFAGLSLAPTAQTTARLDLRKPGRVPQPRFAPPLRPRAVAPPVGDMAVGTMLVTNRSFVNVTGPAVTLTLKDAPAKDALMSLARLGGYGFVFVDEISGQTSATDGSSERPVTMAFRGERFDRALNSVLMASGLQAKLDGTTLLIGTTVSAKTFGPQMSKIIRLNQADSDSASQYLGNLGAQISVTNTTKITSRSSERAGTSSSSSESSTTSESDRSESEFYGSGVGPLLGLIGTTDTRLNTITLIGDSQLIALAQSYLRQIDLRTRQVAVKVQMLSVSLSNTKDIDSSFSARIGEEFFVVSDSGQAHMNFGRKKPGGVNGAGLYSDGVSGAPGVYRSQDPLVQQQRAALVPKQVWVPGVDGATGAFQSVYDANGQPIYVPSSNPNATDFVNVYDANGQPVYVKGKNPDEYRQADDSFYSYLEARITSASAKTLAEPTLLIQEGQVAAVETGQSVVTGVTEKTTQNGTTSSIPTRENAGLKVEVDVARIDDNGFITLSINPEVSVAIPTDSVSGGYQISDIQARKMNSGQVRLRDGQSLVLTGVIQDTDREVAKKWPILGDLPIVGQLFRSTSSTRQKDELVIIVTPRILDDEQGGAYGYGYRPQTPASREMLRGRY